MLYKYTVEEYEQMPFVELIHVRTRLNKRKDSEVFKLAHAKNEKERKAIYDALEWISKELSKIETVFDGIVNS